MLDANFEWDKSYTIKPTSYFDSHVSRLPKECVKWTLYALCKKYPSKHFSIGRKPILSVKMSSITGAKQGCFSEREFNVGDVITV